MKYEISALSTRLSSAYGILAAAIQQAHAAANRSLEAQVALKDAQGAILLQYAENPKELGGNETARTASIDRMTTAERKELAEAQGLERQARNEVELARLEVEAARAQLRLLEVAAGVERQPALA